MSKRAAFFAILAALAIIAPPCLAEHKALHLLHRDKKHIKAYLGQFTNESGQSLVSAEGFKKAVEDSLIKRRAVRFEIAQSPELSKVQITVVIKSYKYMEHGPVKPSPSVGGMLLDIAASSMENYAEMAAEFTVTDTGTGKVLWKDTIGAYEKKIMTPEQSLPIIYDKVARAFLWKSFGKPVH